MVCKECNQEFQSLDSLRRHRVQKHKISAERTYIDYVLYGFEPKCKCGCGLKTNFLSIEKGFTEYIRGHAARINNNWGHNKKALDKSHETQKRMHENGELVIWNKGLTIEDERVKNNIVKVMSNPNRSNNISKKLLGVSKNEEHKKKIKEKAKKRWKSIEEREKQSHRRMLYIIKNGFQIKSKLEKQFKNILINDLQLVEDKDFYPQYYVREIKALYDFKISGKNIMIEVDGDYWHCNPTSNYNIPIYEAQISNLKKDKIKDDWCLKNNIKLLRFWESDIKNNKDGVIKQLKEELGFD